MCLPRSYCTQGRVYGSLVCSGIALQLSAEPGCLRRQTLWPQLASLAGLWLMRWLRSWHPGSGAPVCHSGGGLVVVWTGLVGRVQPRAERCSGLAPALMVCAGQCEGAGRKGPIMLLVLAEEAAVGLLQPVCFCHPGLCNKALTKFKATMIYFFLQFCGLAACN